jgi:hypothetical protein
VRVIDEVGLSYDPTVTGPPSLRPYVIVPLGTRLLVLRRDQDRRALQWLSLADGSVATLDEGDCPDLAGALTLDVDRDGSILVLSERRRRIAILDSRGTPRQEIPWALPGDPIAIHCLDDGSFVVGTWKPGAVHRLDRLGNVRWSWSPGPDALAEARAVAPGPRDLIYVADASLHRVIAVAPSGEVVRAFGMAGSPGYGPGRFANPSMLEVDPSGGVLVTDTRNHRLVALDADGAFAWEWPRREGDTARPAQLSMPWCARRLPGGGLAIADTYNFRVLELDERREIVRAVGHCPIRGRRLSLPRSAERLGPGRYLIADTYNDRVVEMGPGSKTVSLLGGGPSGQLFWPRCALRLGDGRTVVADGRHDRLVVTGPRGTEAVVHEIRRGDERSALRDPHDVVATADGHFLVADTGNHRVVEVSADGACHWSFPSEADVAAGWRLRDPHNASLDEGGRVLVSDTGNHRVLVVERRTGRVEEIRRLALADGGTTELREPRGCHFRFGHYFILDSGTPRVLIADRRHRVVWSWDGRLLGSPLAQILRPPRWLSVVSPRRLLVTDSVTGRVVLVRLPRWWTAPGQRN